MRGVSAWQPAGPAPGDGAGVDPEAAREAARAILDRPEFQPEERSLLVRFFDWLGRHLPDFWRGRQRPGIDPGYAGGRGASSVVLWVALVIVVAIVAALIARYARRNPAAAKKKKSSDANVERDELHDDLGPGGWDGVAAAHEASGQWAEAVRARYRAAVGRVADSGVEVPPGRTAGELRHTVAGRRPTVAEPFGQLTDTFEGGWYGGRPLGPAEGSVARELAGQVTVLLEVARSDDVEHGDARRADSGVELDPLDRPGEPTEPSPGGGP